jgi:DNA repair exonuclease SbcCD nuclease subunit
VLIGLTADSHLDARMGTRHVNGINARALDHERALEQVVDGFIRAEVAIAIFAGDIFDSARPTELARQKFVHEVRRLFAALPDVRVLILRGNHDCTANWTDATPIGTAALALPEAVVADAYAPLVFEHAGVAITMVPWMSSDEEFRATIDAAATVPGRHNLLILHAGFLNMTEDGDMRSRSQTLTRDSVPTERFDWIFSGHYHGYHRFDASKFTFIGSSERKSVAEVGQRKGFLTYDTETGTESFHAITVRPWLDLGPVNAQGWDGQRVLAELRAVSDSVPDWDESIVRLRVTHLAPDVYASLDVGAIKSILGRTFEYQWDPHVDDPVFAGGIDDGDESLLPDMATAFADFAASLEGRTGDEIALVNMLGQTALEGRSLELAYGEAQVPLMISGEADIASAA